MIKYYGQQENGKQPKESAEMITFVNHVRRVYPDSYGKIITHVRNEGKRSIEQTQKQKAEGMTTGASDISIPGCPSFVCEMKSKSKTAKTSPEQIEYLTIADRCGAFSCVVYGYIGAIEALEEWISVQR